MSLLKKIAGAMPEESESHGGDVVLQEYERPHALPVKIKLESDIEEHLAAFRKTLRENSDPARAENEKRYLKSPYKFFGVTVPFVTKTAKDFKRDNGDAGRDYVFTLTGKLWDSGYTRKRHLP